jgi:hypothetical protein
MEPLSSVGADSYCRRVQRPPAEVLRQAGPSLPALLRRPTRTRAQRPQAKVLPQARRPAPPRSAPQALSSTGFLELDLIFGTRSIFLSGLEEGSKRFSIGGSKVIPTVLYFSCVQINADFVLWLINDIINNACICLCK